MTDKSRQIAMPMQTRLAPITGVNAETRTVDVTWSTGARVKRYDWERGNYYLEELAMGAANVRLGRLNGGAPLLDTHNRYDLSGVLGVVEQGSAKVDGKSGSATVRFSAREEVAPVFRDVKDKIITNVSAGYVTHRMEQLPPDDQSQGLPVYRAVDWEPMEISLVPIGADAGAGVRSEQQQRTFPCEVIDTNPAAPATQRKETSTMKTEEQLAAEARVAEEKKQQEARDRAAAEAEAKTRAAAAAADELERVQGIRALCTTHKLDRAFEDTLIGTKEKPGPTLEKARQAVLDKLAEKTEDTEVRSGAGGIETVTDETVQRREMMTNALMHRANPAVKLVDGARQYSGYTMRELMRRCLEIRGIRTDGLSVNQMWERTMQSGSDLPAIVLDAANKSLRAAYESSPRTFVPWSKQGSAPDFKNINRIALSGAPALIEVKSGGEYKRGNVSDGKEVYALATYGRILGINRQTIINDDLDAFTRLPALAARAAADLESDTVYGVLTANGTMQDNTVLFSTGTNRLNLTTGAATGTINVASLGVGRAAMRKQRGLEGRPLNVRPSFLIVPVALESLAEQFTSSAYVASAQAAINPFSAQGRSPLTPIAEPRLDDVATYGPTQWYLAGDPAQIDTVEYSYLEGQPGVYMESRMGWDVDGLELKVRLDFAAKALDFRGLYSNRGA
jgi:hypothetical protein